MLRTVRAAVGVIRNTISTSRGYEAAEAFADPAKLIGPRGAHARGYGSGAVDQLEGMVDGTRDDGVHERGRLFLGQAPEGLKTVDGVFICRRINLHR